MKTFFAAVLIGGCFIFSPGTPLAQSCMSDKGNIEAAEGRLSRGLFKDAAGRPETAYIMTLPVAACLSSSDPEMRVKGTRRIHVFSSNDAIMRQIGSMVGKSVKVRGRPFGAHTSHHHAPIVMDIAEIGAH